MIDLTLSRISKLLSHLRNPQLTYSCVHVAGTNGKGSTVSYITAVLTAANIRNGRFTSPHMVSYNDCVAINNVAYPAADFARVAKMVRGYNDEFRLGCTEFELLTATAFKIFEIERVSVAVVEVGLGGRLDATNVLSPGAIMKEKRLEREKRLDEGERLDEEKRLDDEKRLDEGERLDEREEKRLDEGEILDKRGEKRLDERERLDKRVGEKRVGESLGDISDRLSSDRLSSDNRNGQSNLTSFDLTSFDLTPTLISCAITKIGVDHESFLGTSLREIASHKAGIIKKGVPVVVDASNDPTVLAVVRDEAVAHNSPLFLVDGTEYPELFALSPLSGEYQRHNLSVAAKIVSIIQEHFPISQEAIRQGIRNTSWPGRLQRVEFKKRSILLDGAHNESAAIELAKYVDSHVRESKGVIYVIGLTRGKSARSLFAHIVRKGDTVVFTPFSQPENMPWVSCMGVEELGEIAREEGLDVGEVGGENVGEVLEKVIGWGDERGIVVCGSLYLAADLLRLTEHSPDSPSTHRTHQALN